MAHPVMVQPGGPPQQQWMSPPTGLPPSINCPPGLEYLTVIDQLLCHQVVELLEAFTGWETNNRYVIKNAMGQQVYYAFEDTGVCMRMCCGARRKFTIHIVDNYNKEVMRIFRPFKCCAGCCWCAAAQCCAHETFVEAPPGNLVGSLRQTSACCSFNYDIRDAEGNTQLIIDGPCCTCKCCSDVEFPVYSKDKQSQVGCITKQWSGIIKEMYTDADNFGITFPMDLDVKTKATLIGATFLIDFMAFEDNDNKNR